VSADYDLDRSRRGTSTPAGTWSTWPSGARSGVVEGYFDRLIEFAQAARWGRRRVTRGRRRATPA
jgi:hypothetical protein